MRADAMTTPLLVLIASTFTITHAAAESPAGTGDTPREKQPDTELLEFIAVFEPADGAWLDPMYFFDSAGADSNAADKDHE